MLVFDVGMHRGEDTRFFLRKNCHVVGFEADPGLAAWCRGKYGHRMRIIEGAIVENPQGTVEFFKNLDIDAWGTVRETWRDRNVRRGTAIAAIKVGTVDFVKALQAFGIPDYMHVDIEGADMVCIEALREFENRPSYVSIESEDFNREMAVLTELGYVEFQVLDQNTRAGEYGPWLDEGWLPPGEVSPIGDWFDIHARRIV